MNFNYEKLSENIKRSESLFFIPHNILANKIIALASFVERVYFDNNIFLIYNTSLNGKRILVINTNYSYALLGHIMKNNQSDLKKIYYFDSPVKNSSIITFVEKSYILKDKTRFSDALSSIPENTDSKNSAKYTVSNSLTIPFDLYINDSYNSNIVKQFCKDNKIEIIDLFSYYFYLYLNENNISGKSFFIEHSIEVKELAEFFYELD